MGVRVEKFDDVTPVRVKSSSTRQLAIAPPKDHIRIRFAAFVAHVHVTPMYHLVLAQPTLDNLHLCLAKLSLSQKF